MKSTTITIEERKKETRVKTEEKNGGISDLTLIGMLEILIDEIKIAIRNKRKKL